MSSRIATGPIGVSDSIRARIRTDPSLLEEDLRLLGHDLQAGEAGLVDAIGVDRAGRLVIVAVAPADVDRALGRLLDLHVWSTDQRDLLGRLFAAEGVDFNRPARFVLLSPSLPHALVRRLAVLPIDVTLLLARPVTLEDGTHIVIEAAAPILGLGDAAATVAGTQKAATPRQATASAGSATSASRTAASSSAPAVSPAPSRGPSEKSDGRDAKTPAAGATPFWPDEVLPADLDDEKAIPLPPTMELDTDALPWPGSPDDRFPWELSEDPLPLPDEPVAPPPKRETVFETLSADEMQEFVRFDKQRRERDGRSS